MVWIMTLYFKLKIKSYLTDPQLLGWSIGFIEFWVLMWIFIFSANVSVNNVWNVYVVKTNVSLAYSFLGPLSLSSVAIGLTYGFFYMSKTARFITKYTKLSPLRLLIEDFISSIIVMLITVSVIIVSVIGLAYFKWGVVAIPENIIGVYIDLTLGSILLYWLAYMIALILIITRMTKALSMSSFIPLIVGFIAYSELWVDFNNLAYIIPLASLPALIIYHSTNSIPPTGAYLKWLFSNERVPLINLRLASISVFAWIGIFILVTLLLLRKSRGVDIEEIRF